jgi:hypothetical protein
LVWLLVDGIADLISDVNNIEEANSVVQEIMTLDAGVYTYSPIMTVIHTNFNTSKPTGHLGSAMEKKAETQIQLEKDKANSNMINVICKSSRSRSFDTFSFYVNEYSYPQIADANINWIDTFIDEDKIKHINKTNSAPIRSRY